MQINVWLRSKATYFLVAICVVIMVTWLVPWNSLLSKSRGATGTLFDKAVSPDRMVALQRTLYTLVSPGERQRPDFQQRMQAQALDALILDEAARRYYGISASDADVADYLQGRFPAAGGARVDSSQYRAFLRGSGISAGEFESSLKTLLTGGQVLQVVRSSVTLPAEEAWLWYSRDKARVKAAYIELRAEDLAPLVHVDDAALLAFYEAHKQISPDDPKAVNGVGYLEPKRVKIEYILCPYQPYRDAAVVTKQQIASYYEAHKDQYPEPKVQGKPLPGPKPLAEVAGEIETTLRQAEAARAADEVLNEVSDAVAKATEVPFGTPDERVADFAAIAREHGLTCEVSKLFSAKEAEAEMPGAYELASKAFTTHELVPSQPIAARDGKFIFQIPPKGSVNEQPAPFDAVRKRVETDYRREMAYELAVKLASAELSAPNLDAAAAKIEAEIADRLKALPAPAAGAKENPPTDPKAYFKRGESEFFGRPQEFPQLPGMKWSMTTGLPGSFNYVNFSEEAFAVPDGKLGLALERSGARAAYLLMRVGVKPADRDEFDKDKARIEQDLLARKQNTVVQAWLADIHRRANPSGEIVKNLASDEM